MKNSLNIKFQVAFQASVLYSLYHYFYKLKILSELHI
nr:MAG TPA: hypothetical protein [Caudoviricetes sp.]